MTLADPDALPKIGAPATRAVTAAGYPTLRSLAGVSRKDLLALHGFGPKAAGIIDSALAEAGLKPLAP